MDLLLAAMGVILDAVPLFAEGSDLPGAGVLLAVHDRIGDPLFVVTAEANSAMTKMLLPVLEQARELIGPTRCITIVFDRAGWSPKLFQKILALNFDILTYSDDPMGSAGYSYRVSHVRKVAARELLRYYEVEMIRKFGASDMEPVLDIWLSASIIAHDFVETSFWESQVENMRNTYIPASENYVYESNSKVVGFYSLKENILAAIFVSPEFQGKGIGKQLMSHAKKQREGLTLSVYKENEAGCQFYFSQGFSIVSEQTDERTGHREYTMSLGT